MEVVILPNACQAVGLVSKLIESRVAENPKAVLGLATGGTMEQVYERLTESRISFAQCHTFNLDEYIGLPPEHPGSFRYYMRAHFFSKVDIPLSNTHVPDGTAWDLHGAAMAYEESIESVGGIDVQLLGIGQAGHIGFNEPLSSLASRTRDKCLTEVTRKQNVKYFGGKLSEVPTRAITMGVGTILNAQEIIMLATGSAKADIVAKAIEGPVTSMVSASAIQLHPNCKVVLDNEAAAELGGREYYEFVFANEPHWANYRDDLSCNTTTNNRGDLL